MLTCFWSLLHVGTNACLLKYMYKFYEPVQNLTVCIIKYVLHLVQFNKKILKKIVCVSIFFCKFHVHRWTFCNSIVGPYISNISHLNKFAKAAMFFLWRQLFLSSQAFYRILLRNANAILLARPFRNGSFCSVPG